MAQLIHTLQNFVWGPGMLVFFLATGVRFTLKSRLFQVAKVHLWIGNTVGALIGRKEIWKTKDEGAISQFQSFCTALAATLGTGNITGVATALILGGPGAIFWMWISAFLGMMTNYAENYLGIRYRYRDQQGRWIGGAMVYMERGLDCKPLAVWFACCCLGASFGMGNMVQGNSLSKGLEETFHIPVCLTGIMCTIGIACVVLGGTKRLAAMTEKLVPMMAIFYLSGALVVLHVFRKEIPGAFSLIFSQALQLKPAVGGVSGYGVGQAIRVGVARGIFSNEAGLGSSVMAHAQSDVQEPEIQGMWGILEIFIDTIVVCTMTALVILVSGVYQPHVLIDGTTLTGLAFGQVFPFGEELLAISTVLFAFATMLGWSYFGEQTAVYLGGEKWRSLYRILFVLMTFPGCVMEPGIIWELADALNGMMAIPNLLALFFLGNQVKYM